jgi:hypothetical protein
VKEYGTECRGCNLLFSILEDQYKVYVEHQPGDDEVECPRCGGMDLYVYMIPDSL